MFFSLLKNIICYDFIVFNRFNTRRIFQLRLLVRWVSVVYSLYIRLNSEFLKVASSVVPSPIPKHRTVTVLATAKSFWVVAVTVKEMG